MQLTRAGFQARNDNIYEYLNSWLCIFKAKLFLKSLETRNTITKVLLLYKNVFSVLEVSLLSSTMQDVNLYDNLDLLT